MSHETPEIPNNHETHEPVVEQTPEQESHDTESPDQAGQDFEETKHKSEEASIEGIKKVKEELTELANKKEKEEIFKKYFSYQDTDLSPEQKLKALNDTRSSESADRYSESFTELVNKYGLEKIETVSNEMTLACNNVLSKLNIVKSPYAESKTWSIWDISKQFYFLTHPQEADPRYKLGNPIDSEEKHQEIANRHIGWEVFVAYKSDPCLLDKIKNEKLKEQIRQLLEKQPKADGQLSSKDLSELGSLISIEISHETNNTRGHEEPKMSKLKKAAIGGGLLGATIIAAPAYGFISLFKPWWEGLKKAFNIEWGGGGGGGGGHKPSKPSGGGGHGGGGHH